MAQHLHAKSWIGVDLDGTLAHYDHWRGADHIGKPVKLMVRRVQAMIAKGYTVKIFTARAHNANHEEIKFIEDWTEEHLGHRLEITCIKDPGMIQLYDDRAVQVMPNTGKIVYLKKDKVR